MGVIKELLNEIQTINEKHELYMNKVPSNQLAEFACVVLIATDKKIAKQYPMLHAFAEEKVKYHKEKSKVDPTQKQIFLDFSWRIELNWEPSIKAFIWELYNKEYILGHGQANTQGSCILAAEELWRALR